MKKKYINFGFEHVKSKNTFINTFDIVNNSFIYVNDYSAMIHLQNKKCNRIKR